MTLLLPFLLLATQDRTVTVSFPPTAVPKAIEAISTLTGQHLKASSDFENEVLVARLKNAPVKDVMKYLAESLCAKWESRDDGSLMLVEDPVAIRRQADQKALEDETHLMNSLAYFRKKLAEQPAEMDSNSLQKYLTKKDADEKRRKAAEAGEDWARMFAASDVSEESPGWRALARLTLLTDPKFLLLMPNDGVTVFAENPTQMQHPMPDGAAEVLATYRHELALLEPNVTVARVKFCCMKWEEGSALSVKLEAQDSSGKSIDEVFGRMNDDSELMKIPYGSRPTPQPKVGEKPILIPEDVRQFRAALSREYKGYDRSSLAAKYRPQLIDPVKFEPTSAFRGEDLVLAAEASDQNVIGTVSDLTGASFAKPEVLTPTQVFNQRDVFVLSSTPGWVVVRDTYQVGRASRSKARELLNECMRNGGISVNAAADWVAQTPGRWPFNNWLGDYLHTLFSGAGPYSALATTIDEQGLRLWGTFGPGVMESLRKGDSLRVSDLSSESRTQIERMVYWFSGLDDGKIDPTDKLPNGIVDGTLSMTIKDTPVIVGWSPETGPPATPMPMDAEKFGKCLAVGNTYWEIPADTYRTYTKFKVGSNRAYDIHFVLNPGQLPMTVHLSETLFPPTAEVLDQLPDELKAAVNQARQAAIAAPKKTTKSDVIPPVSP